MARNLFHARGGRLTASPVPLRNNRVWGSATTNVVFNENHSTWVPVFIPLTDWGRTDWGRGRTGG